jgi:hypothetical protein
VAGPGNALQQHCSIPCLRRRRAKARCRDMALSIERREKNIFITVSHAHLGLGPSLAYPPKNCSPQEFLAARYKYVCTGNQGPKIPQVCKTSRFSSGAKLFAASYGELQWGFAGPGCIRLLIWPLGENYLIGRCARTKSTKCQALGTRADGRRKASC